VSVAFVLTRLLDFYSLLIFVYVIMSWFPMRSDGIFADLYRVLGSLAEPYIGIFRRIVPTAGAVDFSPLVALLVLHYLIRPALSSLLGTLGL